MQPVLRLAALPVLVVLGGCTSLSGLDDKVFDLAGAPGGGGAAGGEGGTAGSGGGTAGGGGVGGGGGCVPVTKVFSATDLDYTVPAGVSYMHAKAWGGGGNGECLGDDAVPGGAGGFTEAVLPITPGSPLLVIIGGQTFGPLSTAELLLRGFPGIGGGGLSGVFSGPDLIDWTDGDRALIIAGGGGGAAVTPGGSPCFAGNPGNHETLAGNQPGLQGGDGTEYNGGGGGLLGGDGGTVDQTPGRGGTHFIHPTALFPVFDSSEPENPQPPGTDDPDYADEAGVHEKKGRVVLHFLCEQPTQR